MNFFVDVDITVFEMSSETDIIQSKDFVILKRGNHILLHQLSKKPRVQFLGSNIDLSNILEKQFSTFYRIEMIHKHSYSLELCDPNEVQSLAINCIESGIDNRNIQDDNNAQALSKEEIIGMRNEGLSSQNIVQQLINNSKTFSHKTEFAQEKWLRKKSKKYSDYLQVLKPSIRLLSEVLMCNTSNPNSCKLLGLRLDTLSQIITAVNFQSQGKYIIYENNCEGLIIATLMNLVISPGKLLNVITPNYSFNKRKALAAMKFPEEKQKSVLNINLSTFAKYSSSKMSCSLREANSIANTPRSVTEPEFVLSNSSHQNEFVEFLLSNSSHRVESSELVDPSSHRNEIESNMTLANEKINLKRKAEVETVEVKKSSYLKRESEEVRQLLIEKADGLVVVCKENPCDFVKEMLQFLGPSRSFVVYHQFQAPLIRLYEDLKQCPEVINIRLVENWLRSYQVLPDRTHPEINMLGSGGYLLSGITVTDCTK